MADSLVSVIIPTFNRDKVIKRAITSVLNQTYKNLEIIVIDDGSFDNASYAITSLNEQRIRFFRHNSNKGPSAARNTGIRNAQGEYVTFLDSDDEWLPEKIERQLEIFSPAKEDIGLVFTNGYNEIESRDAIVDNIASGVYYNPLKDRFYPLRKLIVPPSGWMLPKKVIEDIGYFDESMSNWEDGDYLVRIAYKYPIFFLNEKLVIWHDSLERLNLITPNLIKGKEIFLRKNFAFLKKDREYLFRFYRTIGKDASRIDKKRARHYFLNALKLKPFDFSLIGKLLQTF